MHDWLYSISGAEKVVEAIYELFPSSIYTLVKNSKYCKSQKILDKDIHCSFIQKLPFGKTKYPYYLPLFPLAIENLDVSSAEVVLSSSSCVAKGVLTHSEQLHICYCHTPARVAWDMYFDYLKMSKLEKGLLGAIARGFLHKIRAWDLLHAQRVDHYIANSSFVAKRIEKLYRRKATVIYPPVDTEFYTLEKKKKEEFYLTASRFVPYKRVDLIVKAFSHLKDKKLVVVGDGPEGKNLRKLATKNVEFAGYVDDETLKSYFQSAKAFIYAAKEDFGIVPVEAQSCGLPVIAFQEGGVKETVVANKTGVFFQNQTEESLIEAISHFEKTQDLFDPEKIHLHAAFFSKEKFSGRYKSFVMEKYESFKQERFL